MQFSMPATEVGVNLMLRMTRYSGLVLANDPSVALDIGSGHRPLRIGIVILCFVQKGLDYRDVPLAQASTDDIIIPLSL